MIAIALASVIPLPLKMNPPNYSRRFSLRRYTLLAAALGAGSLAHGSTINYVGTTSTDWADGANWTDGVAPANDLITDIAWFNRASGAYPNAPTAGVDTRVNGIVIGNGTTSVSGATFGGTQLSIGSAGIDVKALSNQVTFNTTTIVVGADQTWTNNSTNSLTVASVLSGTSTLTTTGTGTILLTGATSNYAGSVIVAGGSLYISGGSSLNSTFSSSNGGVLSATSTVSVASGANLGIRNTHNLIAGLNDVSGAGGTVGMAQNTTGRSLTIAGSGTYSFSGVVTDRLSGFTGSTLQLVIGNGTSTTTQTFKGANDYSGTTIINPGSVLNIQNSTGLGSTAAGTTVQSGSTLQLQGGISVGAEALTVSGNGASGQTGALVSVSGNNTFAGTLSLGNSGSGNTISSNAGLFTLSNTAAVTVSNNRTLILAGAGDGVFAGRLATGAITKTGTGTWTLTGAHTYTLATAVSAGKLFLDGSLTSAVTVASGATFGGTGSSTAALTLSSGAIYAFDISTAGFFDTTSTITLGNLTASLSLLGSRSGTQLNDVITVMTSVAATSGTFGNLANGGTIVSQDGITWQANYTGNGLTLTAISLGSPIPEPSTYALLAGIGAVTFAMGRRRRSIIGG